MAATIAPVMATEMSNSAIALMLDAIRLRNVGLSLTAGSWWPSMMISIVKPSGLAEALIAVGSTAMTGQPVSS
jgi:hypothetical protein